MVVCWQLYIHPHFVMGTHWRCLVNCLFVSIMSWVLIMSVLTFSICLHYAMVLIGGVLTILYLSPLRHRTHGAVLTIVYLSPLCHVYSLAVSWQWSIFLHNVRVTHLGCLVNPLFDSIMSWVLIGVSLQLSICLHYVIAIHKKCLDSCLFVSIISWVLIGVS